MIVLISLLVLFLIITTTIISINNKKKSKSSHSSGPEPKPAPSNDWVYRDIDKQSDGVTHYWDCCKETCSWFNNAPNYGTNQCNTKGEDPRPPDNSTSFPKSVCDDPNTGNATCQNRYPEIIKNKDNTETLMGFVATGKQLFPDFSPDKDNNYCGQCYEIEFYNTNKKSNIKNAIVQVTNTGDADGIFDFEVPGGGFGANNGCKNYSTWKVYTDQGGPCDTQNSTCSGTDNNITGCAIYGGFQNQKYCNTAFGSDTLAKNACNNILWGVFPPQGNNHCPGFPNNLKIKKYRPIKCPKWHIDKTGINASKAPLAKKAKKNGDVCNNDNECATRNCYNNKCDNGDFDNGKNCSYDKQCKSKYCNNSVCSNRPEKDTCWYNDNCFNGNKNICNGPKQYCDTCPDTQRGKSTDNFPDFIGYSDKDKYSDVKNWGQYNNFDEWNKSGNKTVYC